VADDAVGTAQIHVPHTGTVDVGHAAVEIQDLQAVFTAVDNAPVDVVGGPSRLVSDQAAVQLCFGLGQEGILESGALPDALRHGSGNRVHQLVVAERLGQ
jgi:hypothetical protein